MDNNTKEIIKLIKSKQMTPDEGFEIIKNQTLKAPRKTYYKEEWTKINIVKKNKLGVENILLFDINKDLRDIISKEDLAKVILVKPSKEYKKISDKEYEINPVNQEDYKKLLNDIGSDETINILHNWCIGNTYSEIDDLLNISVNSMFYLFKEILKLKEKKEVKMLYLHKGYEIEPQFLAVGNFLKTINIENPNYLCKSISIHNCQDSNNILGIVMKEIAEFKKDEIEIKYSENNERYIRGYKSYYPLNNNVNKSAFKENGVYIITGGAGGIGLILSNYITSKVKCNIVLTGRSPLNQEKEEKINEIDKKDSQIIYIQSDVSKKDSVENLVKEVKNKFNKVDGIIHSAGVLRDSFFMKKPKKDFDTVLSPKVYGTMWLDEATRDEQLDFFVTFSSIAATLGNIGQTDYSYANSFMDYYIKRREELVKDNKASGKSLSINWPLWSDGGMTIPKNTVEWLKENLGLQPLTSKNGMEGIEDALQSNENQLVIVEGELEKLNKLFILHKDNEEVLETKSENITNKDKEILKEKVENYLKSLLSQETKLPINKIDSEVDFEKYGIDSVMVMNFNRELENFFGNVSKTLFYENQTINDLANYLLKKYESKVMNKFGISKEKKAEPTKEINIPKASKRKSKKELLKTKGNKNSNLIDNKTIADDIAIIGLSGRYPMAESLDEFWNNLKAGKDCISEIPSDRWDYREYFDSDKNKKGTTYSKWGGFIKDVDKFDPLFFGISPRDASYLDPQERIFLQTAWHTLEDAGYTRESLSGSNTGVFVGVMFGHYQLFGVEESMKGNVIGLNSSYASIANRVSYTLNLKGPSMGLDTMCSSSLTAIHIAIQSILRGDCDTAIAGGVNVTIHPNKYILLSQSNFPSTDGRCRSFGEGGDGYVPGEGTGAVLLKPLKKAIKDNDRIYGVIKGSALNHGGKTSGYSVPNPNAQSELISKVLKESNIDARTISYIEAHGTGTALGDPIEITGLVNAFEKDTNEKGYCSIGSVKSNIGHTESAAGIAGITKLLLQMKYKELVPSIHSKELNPNIDFDETPFVVQRNYEKWEKPVINGVTYPRRGAISSFGAGGSNAHIIIEEYDNKVDVVNEVNTPQIIVLSAKSEERLKVYSKDLLHHLDNNKNISLTEVAYTLQVGREAMTNRLAIVTSSIIELKEKLNDYINNNYEVDNLYTGDLSEDGNEKLLVGKESKRLIKSLIENNNLNELAKLWVEGGVINWRELCNNKKIEKIALPTYPFAKERYWIPNSQNSENKIGTINKLHPLIHKNTSTLEVQKFTTILNGKEFFIQDHLIEGSNLLPGVAYIEMARVAGKLSGISNVTKITDISWTRPIAVKDSPCEVSINLYPDNNNVEYEISTLNGFGEEVVNGQGKIAVENKIKEESIDIESIKKRCSENIDSIEIYNNFMKNKFNYGDRLKPIKTTYIGDGELLSYLQLPEILKESFKEYGLHPTLFDGALQSVSSLINNDDNIVYLPYSIKEVEIINEFNEECFVYVKATLDDDDSKKYNIYIIDEKGNLIVKVKDFLVKARAKTTTKKQIVMEEVKNTSNTDLLNEEEKELRERLEKDLIILVSKTLQIDESKIDVKKDMSHYGFDSITFTEFANIINKKYGLNVVPSLFYEHATLLSVVEYFIKEYKDIFANYYLKDLDEVKSKPVKEAVKEEEVEIIKPSKPVKKRKRYIGSSSELNKEPIAIVGISGVMPGSENLDEFWNNLQDGKDLITEIPKDRWDWKKYYGDPVSEANKTNVKWGGFIKDVDKFDPLFFGISPREAELMDPQQRIFLQMVWKAIEDAGYSVGSLSGSRTGVFVGVSNWDYSDLLKKYNIEIQAQIPSGISHSVIANRVSYLLNLNGPSEPIDTACSSSLIAVHRAVESIRYGNCKMAIAGGVSVIASPETYVALSKAGMICEDGRCKTFDKSANGYVRGEGCGAIVLKPLKDAIADNDHIYGVIKGSYVNHGGHVNSLTTPNPNAQSDVIINAWKESGIDPTTIGYIEAHGSGTSLGDPIEISGLKKAFKKLYEEYDKEYKTNYCGIGSVKTNIGHLESAAGIAGLMKVLLSIKNKKIPASINIKEKNPYLQLEDSPFYIVDKIKNWEVNDDLPRRAGISSFGFGGANAHVVIEEYVSSNIETIATKEEKELIILSAKNEKRLKEYAKEILEYVNNNIVQQNQIIDKNYIINNIEKDLQKIASDIVHVPVEEILVDETLDIYGFDPVKLNMFYTTVAKKYEIDNLFNSEYLSISELANILCSSYKEKMDSIYGNNHSGEENQTNISLKEIAYTLQVGRDAMDKRLAMVVSSIDELQEKLSNYINSSSSLGIYIDEVKKISTFLEGKEGEQFINSLIKENRLDKLAQIWVAGGEINWNRLYEDNKPRRISLPTYPFAKNSYWIPMEEKRNIKGLNIKSLKLKPIKDVEELEEEPKVETLYYSRNWLEAEISNSKDTSSNKLLVFDTDTSITNLIKDKVNEVILVKQGEDFKKISEVEYEINASDKDNYVQLIKSLKEDKNEPSHIVHLWSKEQYSDEIKDKINISANSIYGLSYGLIKEKLDNKVKIVYTYIGKNIPEYDGVSGLLKTASLENSKIKFKTISFSTNDINEISNKLLNELNEESTEVMYSDKRYVKSINEVSIKEDKSILKEKGVYIITGGLGGLGFIFAKYLSKEYNAKLVLTGRSKLDAKKEEKLQELKNLGGDVIYAQGNISKEEDVNNLVKLTKDKYKEINGIIHSAGVIKDAYIINKKEEDIKTVIAPKVYGTTLLDNATKDEQLDFFAMFSSITAVIGNEGQADYAYANTFMDSFSKQREIKVSEKERFGKTISINYPLWREGGMQLDSKIEKMIENNIGIKLLNTDVGIKAFELSLVQDNTDLLVVEGYREKVNNVLLKDKSKEVNYEVVDINETDLLNKIQDDLVNIVSKILKIDKMEIKIDAEMSGFGFDSLSFIEFANKLNENYKMQIIPSVFYEYSTLSSFANYLKEEYKDILINYYGNALKKESVKVEKSNKKPKTKLTNYVNKTIKTNKQNKMGSSNEPVAIIGISGVMPKSNNLEEFWKNLEEGKDLITEIPEDRWDWREIYGNPTKENNKTNIKWGGFLNEVDKFDPLFFGISPKEAELMDPQQRILLQTVWETIEDAGYSSKNIYDSNTGVFIGVGSSDYGDIIKENSVNIESQISTGLSHSILTNRISYLLNLHGPSEPIDTACSSSLTAIHRAVESIQLGHCEMALAGGISIMVSSTPYIALSKAGMLSPDGKCKTFDKDANGYVRGEGAGVLLLKPLSKAIEDKDNIYAVIKGSALNHGGHVNSLTTPNPNAQADVIVKAWRKSGLDPTTINYIEAHGTGTSLGDPIEIGGLKKAFNMLYKEWNKEPIKKAYCGIGSVKTNVGHLEAGAGIAGILKVILSMKHKKIPASININEVNPFIQLDGSPFYIVDNLKNWDKIGETPRRAGISSFGYGGTNAHIVLEEFEMQQTDVNIDEGPEIIVLSAKNEERLIEYAKKIDEFINTKLDSYDDKQTLKEMAYTLQVGRDSMNERLAIIANTYDELKERLKKFINNPISDIDGLYRGNIKNSKPLKILDSEAGKEFIHNMVRNKEIENIVNLWINGYDIDWKLLHNSVYLKMHLPTYPFIKKRYWVDNETNENSQNYIESNEIEDEVIIDIEEVVEKVNLDEAELSNKTEEDLKNIVSELLKIDTEEIDLEENMSGFGFDSITFTNFSTRLNEKYKLNIMPSIFFEHLTLKSLKNYLLEDYREELANYYSIKTTNIKALNKKDNTIGKDKEETKKTFKSAPSKKLDSINEPIAIIGISGVMPGSDNLDEFWSNLEKGEDLISEIPKDRWDWKKIYGNPMREVNKTNIKWGGFMNEIDKFDPLFFGISPREAELMDPQQRIFLQTVWKTIEDAGYSMENISGSKTGVFVGVGTSDYTELIKDYNIEIQAQIPTGVSHCVLANRISYLLDLRGPSEPIDTACSSSLTAIHRAVESIQLGNCEMAIVGGISVMASPTAFIALSKAGMLCEDGRCKTFDKSANGYVRGEGSGAVLLKPLNKAIEDKDHIYAVIKGSHVNHGGHVNSLTTPNPIAQAEVIETAWMKSGINPETITYIEAHGTGTSLGDPIEINGLKKAFKDLYKEWDIREPQKAYCGISSVKTNIGHLESAAGIASLLKVLLAIKYKKIPASINLKEINPYIELENSPFYIVDSTREWEGNEGEPRRAGISSFGYGGINAHIVVEEYIDNQIENTNDEEPQIVVMSAKNEERLMEYVIDMVSFLENSSSSNIPLKNIANTLQKGRDAMEERLSIIASTKEELIEKLIGYIRCDYGMEGLFRGNIKNKKNQTIIKVEKRSDYEVIQDLIDNNDIKTIAQLWANGFKVDWSLVNKNTYKKVPLPTYPFERERCWLAKKEKQEIIQIDNSNASESMVEESIGTMNLQDIIKGIESGEFEIESAIEMVKENRYESK